MLNALSRLRGVRVTGHAACNRKKGRGADLDQIAARLGVRAVLEGSVRRQGTQVRVMIQLVNVADGFQLWSRKFNGNTSDLFTLEDGIAAAVAAQVKVKLKGKGNRTIRLTGGAPDQIVKV